MGPPIILLLEGSFRPVERATLYGADLNDQPPRVVIAQ
jgi:hypothetical protein